MFLILLLHRSLLSLHCCELPLKCWLQDQVAEVHSLKEQLLLPVVCESSVHKVGISVNTVPLTPTE